MLYLYSVVAWICVWVSYAHGQATTRSTTTRATTTSVSLTATNTIYRCNCVFPTDSLTAKPAISVATLTTTLRSPPSTFACGCTSSKLVSTTTSVQRQGTTSSATASSTTNSFGTSSTRTGTASKSTADPSSTAVSSSTVGGRNVRSTILILARHDDDAHNAYSGLQGYGIPYEVLLVPQSGATLPTLNSSSTQGNYGGFIIVSELSYQLASGGWASGLTDDQFSQIYEYQTAFGVRMVRLDTYPWAAFGATPLGTTGGCCDWGVEQLISLTNTSGFSTANLKMGASMSTKSIWHYPAKITAPKTTWEVASYGSSSNGAFSGNSTAAVINDFGGRQQMVFFSGWATEWSATSTFLQHAYIHWMTRGLFVGARKVYLTAQIDDVHLRTQTYTPAGNFYRSVPEDYQMHADWQKNLNKRLPPGSNLFLELGHNGNGDIIWSTNKTGPLCDPKTAIYYNSPADTTLEYQKPLGSGTSVWPTTPSKYTWSIACASIDTLARWFMVPSNLNNFAHVSHTFTHLHQNNATYDDIYKEIDFNQQWMDSVGISRATRFSANALIPPAITGLHNGDAMRAWSDNGITSAVGDNSRPVLSNVKTPFWPLISAMESNGFDGMVIIPRWPTKMYYDCDLPACTTQEWKDLQSGTGTFDDLLASEKSITTRNLMALRHDPYMFHQANLRVHDVPSSTVGTQSGQMSLTQIWVETVVQEMMRLTNWPIVTLKQDDMAQQFTQRMARDQCSPNLSYQYSDDGSSITAVTVSASENSCSAAIPVTFPGAASGGNARDDKLGSEPLIKWVTLSGSMQTFKLDVPVSVRS